MAYSFPLKVHRPILTTIVSETDQDFVSINIVEAERTGNIVLSHSTRLFPDYLRQKHGIGEAYAFPNFPGAIGSWAIYTSIPDMAGMVEQHNDVLSFYKESLLGKARDVG
ncbi:hypothetical protein AbraCBS73388_010396 [Aspergillus brasiliensis]|uniref:Uncharacterized protein n=1 Tax=Aspergillus brasiliensis TaxID=319629 RepID=A0A9W5YU12_9EURO|nr:hypothetical protein AbraCBS73388_010396 [Aspergillus brasiliensis]